VKSDKRTGNCEVWSPKPVVYSLKPEEKLWLNLNLLLLV